MLNGDDSPAFIAADNGFDVWLGNTRGNTFSKAHSIYNPAVDEAYWDFTW